MVLGLSPSKKPENEIWLKYRFKDGPLVVVIRQIMLNGKKRYVLIGLYVDF